VVSRSLDEYAALRITGAPQLPGQEFLSRGNSNALQSVLEEDADDMNCSSKEQPINEGGTE
jgi:hypothetical protein